MTSQKNKPSKPQVCRKITIGEARSRLGIVDDKKFRAIRQDTKAEMIRLGLRGQPLKTNKNLTDATLQAVYNKHPDVFAGLSDDIRRYPMMRLVWQVQAPCAMARSRARRRPAKKSTRKVAQKSSESGGTSKRSENKDDHSTAAEGNAITPIQNTEHDADALLQLANELLSDDETDDDLFSVSP